MACDGGNAGIGGESSGLVASFGRRYLDILFVLDMDVLWSTCCLGVGGAGSAFEGTALTDLYLENFCCEA